MRRIVAFLLLIPFAPALAQPSLEAGEKLFGVCAGCHGFLGEGNALVAAPAIASLEPWYLVRQMSNFTSGVRGAVSGDVHGQRMAVMAQAVQTDRELDDLAAYVASLPGKPIAARVAGNAEEGGRRYAVCAACHGLAAEGNEATSAPALAGLDDWYVVEQLRLYAEGLRGAQAGDVYGQQMRALASTFPDDEARRDLAAYIASLRE